MSQEVGRAVIIDIPSKVGRGHIGLGSNHTGIALGDLHAAHHIREIPVFPLSENPRDRLPIGQLAAGIEPSTIVLRSGRRPDEGTEIAVDDSAAILGEGRTGVLDHGIDRREIRHRPAACRR